MPHDLGTCSHPDPEKCPDCALPFTKEERDAFFPLPKHMRSPVVIVRYESTVRELERRRDGMRRLRNADVRQRAARQVHVRAVCEKVDRRCQRRAVLSR